MEPAHLHCLYIILFKLEYALIVGVKGVDLDPRTCMGCTAGGRGTVKTH